MASTGTRHSQYCLYLYRVLTMKNDFVPYAQCWRPFLWTFPTSYVGLFSANKCPNSRPSRRVSHVFLIDVGHREIQSTRYGTSQWSGSSCGVSAYCRMWYSRSICEVQVFHSRVNAHAEEYHRNVVRPQFIRKSSAQSATVNTAVVCFFYGIQALITVRFSQTTFLVVESTTDFSAPRPVYLWCAPFQKRWLRKCFLPVMPCLRKVRFRSKYFVSLYAGGWHTNRGRVRINWILVWFGSFLLWSTEEVVFQRFHMHFFRVSVKRTR